MKIGVDAGALGIIDERLKVGVYQVNYHLLRELANLDSKNEYNLFSFNPIDPAVMNEFGSRMKNTVLRPSIAWNMIRLPLAMMLDHTDVFLALSQSLPTVFPKTIGFVYDLGFLHHPQHYPDSYRKLSFNTSRVVKNADTIVTISKTVAQDINRVYAPIRARVTVAYPGITANFLPNGKKYIAKHPYFLVVGALKRGKNIPGLLRSFAYFLKKTSTTYDLYLAGGDYWLDPKLHEEISSLGIAKRVRLLGFIPAHELPAYYRGATAFVTPSFYEGFCLPAVEAMACGTPVIGSTTGAFPEVVGGGGILVDPNDTAYLSSALQIMGKPNSRVQYSTKAIMQAKKYSWKKFAQQVYSLL